MSMTAINGVEGQLCRSDKSAVDVKASAEERAATARVRERYLFMVYSIEIVRI